MSRFACHSPLLEPLELSLRRISRRALSDQLTVNKAIPRLESGDQDLLCAGRRPAGLVSLSVDQAESKLGDYLARAAHLEAASVIAFERLAEELTLHGAPSELVERAHAAREDEEKHAYSMHELALLRGGLPVAVRTAEFQPRSLLELALENAVEGCIRETYGALVGAYQAARARDLELRLAFRSIAPDEARHAALAQAVHVWASDRLDAAARDSLRRAQLAAVFELARECSVAPDPELMEAAGLPDSGMACALLGELTKELWLPRNQQAA
jgi:rubrerythrin